MSKKIFLSPSDQDRNVYAVGNTTEAEQCRRFANATEKALKRCGFEVMNDQTHEMEGRVAASDKWGADLHVCIHTNAYNGTVSGTRIFSYDTVNNGYKAAKCVYDVLAPLTPGNSDNIKPYPGLYEIKVPNASSVYIEVDFHDNPSAARWLIDHPTEIGEAICKGICKFYGVTYKEEVPSAPAVPADPKLGEITCVNGIRGENFLVLLVGKTSTGFNQWGVDVIFDGTGTVKSVVNGKANAIIPSGCYCLSGHGINADYLRSKYKVGGKIKV